MTEKPLRKPITHPSVCRVACICQDPGGVWKGEGQCDDLLYYVQPDSKELQKVSPTGDHLEKVI